MSFWFSCWDYRCVTPCPVYVVLGINPGALSMLGKPSTNWAPSPSWIQGLSQNLYLEYFWWLWESSIGLLIVLFLTMFHSADLTCCVDQTGFKLLVILLPLPPNCWDYKVSCHAWLACQILTSLIWFLCELLFGEVSVCYCSSKWNVVRVFEQVEIVKLSRSSHCIIGVYFFNLKT